MESQKPLVRNKVELRGKQGKKVLKKPNRKKSKKIVAGRRWLTLGKKQGPRGLEICERNGVVSKTSTTTYEKIVKDSNKLHTSPSIWGKKA